MKHCSSYALSFVRFEMGKTHCSLSLNKYGCVFLTLSLFSTQYSEVELKQKVVGLFFVCFCLGFFPPVLSMDWHCSNVGGIMQSLVNLKEANKALALSFIYTLRLNRI